MHEQHYSDAFDYCQSKHRHLLQRQVAIPPRTIWPEYCVSYCSRCMCTFLERIIDDVYYGIWLSPPDQKILKVHSEMVMWYEQEQRFRLRKIV